MRERCIIGNGDSEAALRLGILVNQLEKRNQHETEMVSSAVAGSPPDGVVGLESGGQ